MSRFLAIVAVAAVVIGALPPTGADGLVKDMPQRARERAASQPSVPAGSACVDANGTWVNWPYANMPTLSPPCSTPPPAKK